MQLPRSSGVALPAQLQQQQSTAAPAVPTPPITPSPGPSRRASIVAVATGSIAAAAAAAASTAAAESTHAASSPSASPHSSPLQVSLRSAATEQRSAAVPHKAIFIARRAGRQATTQQQQQPQHQSDDSEGSATLMDSPPTAAASIAHGDDFARDLHSRSPVRHVLDHVLEWPTSRQGAPAAASVQHAYLQHSASFSASIDAPFVDASATAAGSSPIAVRPYALSSSTASSPVRSFLPRHPLPPLQHAPSTPRSSNQPRTPRSAQAASGPATRMLRSSSNVGSGEDSGSNVTSPYCRSPCTPFDAADPSAVLPHRSPTSPPVTLPSLVVQTQQLLPFPFSHSGSSPPAPAAASDGKPGPAARVPSLSVVLPQLNPSGREAVGTATPASARLRKLTDPTSHKLEAPRPGAPRIAALDLPAAVASAQASITAQVQADSRSPRNSPALDSPALRRLPRTPIPGDGALDGPATSPSPVRGGGDRSRNKSVSPPALVPAAGATSPKDHRTCHAHKRTDSKLVYDPRMDRFAVDDSPNLQDEEDPPFSHHAAARYSPRRSSGSFNSVAGAADADSAPHSPMHWSDVEADDFFDIQDHEREPAAPTTATQPDAAVDSDSDAVRSESPSELLQPCQQIFSPRVPRRELPVVASGPMHEFDLQVAEPSAGPRPWERGTRRTNAHVVVTASSAASAGCAAVAATVTAAASNRRLHFHSGELPSSTSFAHEQSDLLHELPPHHQQQQHQQLPLHPSQSQQQHQQQHEFDSSAVEGHSPASDGDEQEDPELGNRSGGAPRRKRRDTGSMVDLQGMGSFIAQQLRSKPNLRLHLAPAPMLTAAQESPVVPAPPVVVASALPAHLLHSSGSKVKRIGLRPSMLMNGGSSLGGALDSPSSSSSSSSARSHDAISSDAGASSTTSSLSMESSVASARASYTTFGTPSLLARAMFDGSSTVGVQFGSAGSNFQSPFDSPRHLHTAASPLNLSAGLGFSKHSSHHSLAEGLIGPVHPRRVLHHRHSSTTSVNSFDEPPADDDAFTRDAPQ